MNQIVQDQAKLKDQTQEDIEIEFKEQEQKIFQNQHFSETLVFYISKLKHYFEGLKTYVTSNRGEKLHANLHGCG